MVTATIKVEFNEQAKAVVANTKIELEGELSAELKEEALRIGKELFEEAFKYSKQKTINEK
jgi:hypothetical protein